jgi:PAS domain S-box-containing protein/putative nucleotidyltransferase with HDIG domain
MSTEGLIELRSIVDVDAIQALMDDFYGVTGVGMALLERSGAILVRTGWQDICTRFHRVHPVTSARCLESDTQLSQGVSPGEHKLYRCRNGMWDMATPVMVDGCHAGNLFLGQFFFADQEPDREWFRAQAREFGFDEAEYLTALDRVPRWDRAHVDEVMRFYAHFATLVAEMGHAGLVAERANVALRAAVAEREELARALESQRRSFETLVEHSPDLVVRFDRELRHIYGNEAAARGTGLTREQCVGRRPSDLPLPPENAAFMERSLKQALESGADVIVEQSLPTPAGDAFFETRIVPERGESGEVETLLAVTRDVTERRRAEDEARSAREHLQRYIDACPEPIFMADWEGRFHDCNPAAESFSGYSRDELLSMTLFELISWPSAKALAGFEKHVRRVGRGSMDLEVLRKDGSPRWIALDVVTAGDERLLGYCVDVTERRRRQEVERGRRRRAEVRAALLRDVLAARTEDGIYAALATAVCGLETGARTFASRYDPSRDVLRLSGHAGFKGKIRGAITLIGRDPRLLDFPFAELPEAVREGLTGGRVFAYQGELADLACKVTTRRAGRAVGKLLDVGSIYVAGLSLDGSILGMLTILLPDGGRLEHPELVETTVHEAALAVQRLRAEQRAVAAADALGRALEGTISAMGAVIEMRDPYTAGHERRVTHLALAVAERLGLDADAVRALRLAGTVHDLGKIAIPAEILSKPGQLTHMERVLVQRHPEIGYQILSGVDFALPVAQIVLQHHERMDGSGYPQGLGGEQILPEARVLAVADVVEAMASHRPYRPALGIDAALAEIESGRGTLYAADVVDACLAVVRDEGFQLPD